MNSVERRKRDPFFTEDAYAMRIRIAYRMFHGEKFVEDRDKIKEKASGARGARQISFARVRNLIEDIWMRYSAGDPLEGMRERAQYVFEDLQRHQEAFPEHSLKLWEPDAYYFVMLLFSWTIFFNLPDKLPVLAASINKDPDEGEWDPFIHLLFKSFGLGNFPGKTAELLHPKPYAILYESLRHPNFDIFTPGNHSNHIILFINMFFDADFVVRTFLFFLLISFTKYYIMSLCISETFHIAARKNCILTCNSLSLFAIPQKANRRGLASSTTSALLMTWGKNSSTGSMPV